MRTMRIVLAAALFSCSLANIAAAQDKATPQEVVAKVREAAAELSKTHDVSEFNRKQSRWVWKDTYIFVQDCDKKVVAAHPMIPNRAGTALATVKDAKGRRIYPDVQHLCSEARTPDGMWIEYWWPKPGEKADSRKITYFLSAKGSPYIVGAGIYDDKDTIAELQKLTHKK
jgi:cytochrome c